MDFSSFREDMHGFGFGFGLGMSNYMIFYTTQICSLSIFLLWHLLHGGVQAAGISTCETEQILHTLVRFRPTCGTGRPEATSAALK